MGSFRGKLERGKRRKVYVGGGLYFFVTSGFRKCLNVEQGEDVSGRGMISEDVRGNARSQSVDGWNIPGIYEYPLGRRCIGGISMYGVASILARSISGPHRTVN